MAREMAPEDEAAERSVIQHEPDVCRCQIRVIRFDSGRRLHPFHGAGAHSSGLAGESPHSADVTRRHHTARQITPCGLRRGIWGGTKPESVQPEVLKSPTASTPPSSTLLRA